MEIRPTYTTFEQAKWLKEKGFNEKCKSYYGFNEKLKDKQFDDGWFVNKTMIKNQATAPEQWQVVEWLRLNHGIWVFVDWWESKWCYQISDISLETLKKVSPNRNRQSAVYLNSESNFNSPQEAYSSAFDYIINNKLI